MCLEKVTEKDHILEKDMKVFKVVEKIENEYYFSIFRHVLPEKVNEGLNEALITVLHDNNYSEKIIYYNSGYFCFESKEDAERFKHNLSLDFPESSENFVVFEFTIPKGTSITIGDEKWGYSFNPDYYKIIVSPVLIYYK